MSAPQINLARGLRLDPDYIGGGTFALLAKKGWGKTYAMRVMAEEFARCGVPFVCLDPMDAFWGLRAGKGALEVPIFGGPHGDVALESTAGRLMADLVVDEHMSMILSMAHFGSRAAERRFAMDFFDQLYRRNSELVHLLVDEADLFAPQKPQAGDQPLLGVTENIVRRGRNKGIGITLGTQRPAVLNKDVLTQVDGVIVGRMLGPQDRNAIDAWVGEHGDHGAGKRIKDELPYLETGQATIWIPELDVLRKVKIRAARTFDSSPTRKRSSRADRNLALANVDLSGIAGKIAETRERAKAEDPKELRKLLAAARKQIAELEHRPAEAAEPAEVEIEVKVPVFDESVTAAIQATLQAAAPFAEIIATSYKGMAESLADAEALVSERRPTPALRPPPKAPRPTPAASPAAPASVDGELPSAQQRIVDSIAWWNAVGYARPTKQQVGFIAGFKVGKKVGGHYASTLGALRGAGALDYPTPSLVELTPAGWAQARPLDLEPTTAALQVEVLSRLGGSEQRILEVLIAHYPEPLSKREVGEAAGFNVGEKIGGHFASMLGKLRTLGLIDYPTPGQAIAESILFLEGR